VGCSLDTAQGEVKVGAMICYDREFPESARILMLKGAEIILVPNASTLYPIHLEQFRLRAYENMVGVAMTNYAESNNGHSVAFDPIAFDMERIREYRRRETSGNAFRRPHRYGLLTSCEVRDPFVRVGSDGQAYHQTRRRVRQLRRG